MTDDIVDLNEEAYRRMAESLDTHIDQLSEAEKKQAVVNEVVRREDTDEEHDPRDNLPVLLTLGSQVQQALWEPLSEHFRLAFINTNAGNQAVGDGLRVAVLERGVDHQMNEYALNRALWMTSNIMDALYEPKPLFGNNGVPQLRAPHIGNWLPGYAYELILQGIVQASLITKLHEDHGFVGVLVHEDVTPVGKLTVQAGEALGLPTIHIPHANHFLDSSVPDVHRRPNAQHLGVAGEYMAGWYETCGVSRSSMKFLGAPQWDKLYDEYLPSREHARKSFGFEEDDFILAYGTTWVQDTNAYDGGVEDLDRALRIVAHVARSMGAKLIIKMHPGEAPDRDEVYFDIMDEYGLGGMVTRTHNEHVLRAADCLIVQGPSNLGVASMIAGTPVVELFQPSARYPEHYGIPGTWGDGLEAAITESMDAGINEAFVRDMNYDHDGGAVDRTVEWVREICGDENVS